MGLCNCLPDDWVSARGCTQIPKLNAAVESIAECLCGMQCEFDEIAYTSEAIMGTTTPTDNQLNLLFPNCSGCADLTGKIVYLIYNDLATIDFWVYDGTACTWRHTNTQIQQRNNVLLTQYFGGTSQLIDGQTSGYELAINNYVLWNTAVNQPKVGDLLTVNINMGHTIVRFGEVGNPTDGCRWKLTFSGAFSSVLQIGNNTNENPDLVNGYSATSLSFSGVVTTQNTNLLLDVEFLGANTGASIPPGNDDWQWRVFIRNSRQSIVRARH